LFIKVSTSFLVVILGKQPDLHKQKLMEDQIGYQDVKGTNVPTQKAGEVAHRLSTRRKTSS